MSVPVDTLIAARWIAPIDPPDVLLEHHTIAVHDGKIVEILPRETALAKYAATRLIILNNQIVIPGLINLHTHAAMTLMRGIADDKPLMEWLANHIWPVEARVASHDFVRDGALLACAEMLRGGVTCLNDMYFFPEATAQAALSARMRAAIGMIAVEFPSRYAADARDYLDKGLALRDRMDGDPLLTFCLAPHAPYTVSDATFERIAVIADELNVPIHMHVHETLDEINKSMAEHGVRPLQRLQRLGLLGPGLIAVHAIHLTASEIDLLAAHGCHVAHCPASSLKLAAGTAPISSLVTAGVNVGLGTDGAASNNRQDLFSEMRLASLLAKNTSGNAAALPAHQVLAMATINAARALGIDRITGSLTPGKCADITAVDLSAPELAPCYDPLSHLIHAAGREHVSHVWVNGEMLVEDGRLSHLDTAELRAKADYWKDTISAS